MILSSDENEEKSVLSVTVERYFPNVIWRSSKTDAAGRKYHYCTGRISIFTIYISQEISPEKTRFIGKILIDAKRILLSEIDEDVEAVLSLVKRWLYEHRNKVNEGCDDINPMTLIPEKKKKGYKPQSATL